MSKEAEVEAEVEEQRVAAVVFVAPAVEASGKIFFKDLLCNSLAAILCVADMSGGWRS